MACQHTKGLTSDGMCVAGCGIVVAPSLAGRALQIPTGGSGVFGPGNINFGQTIPTIGTTCVDDKHGVKRVFTVPDNSINMASNYEEAKTRRFETGATRSTDNGKPDYDGYLHPLVLHRYGEYMLKHQLQPDGQLRASDNWTQGIPRKSYIKSMLRHVMDVWLILKGFPQKAVIKDLDEALCAVAFNTMGLLHEVLIGRDV